MVRRRWSQFLLRATRPTFAAFLATFWRKKKSVIANMVVYVSTAESARAQSLIEKLASALQRIEEIDPRRFRRLTVLQPIMVVFPGSTVAYSPLTHTILLGEEVLADRPTDMIACWLIHESTHAVIARYGHIRPTSRKLVRMEQICLDEEMDFVRSLSARGTDIDLVSYLARWQRMRSDPAEIRKHHREQIHGELASTAAPSWWRRIVLRLNGITET